MGNFLGQQARTIPALEEFKCLIEIGATSEPCRGGGCGGCGWWLRLFLRLFLTSSCTLCLVTNAKHATVHRALINWVSACALTPTRQLQLMECYQKKTTECALNACTQTTTASDGSFRGARGSKVQSPSVERMQRQRTIDCAYFTVLRGHRNIPPVHKEQEARESETEGNCASNQENRSGDGAHFYIQREPSRGKEGETPRRPDPKSPAPKTKNKYHCQAKHEAPSTKDRHRNHRKSMNM